MIGERLKEERKRLGLSQEEFAQQAGVTRRPYAEWESGNTAPTAVQLAALGEIGVDVQYVVLGVRAGQGVGQAAVHQAVLDAVELLSLDGKVDAQQLAKAVVKLCARSALGADQAHPAQGGVRQIFKGSVGQSVQGNITHHEPVTFNVGQRAKKK